MRRPCATLAQRCAGSILQYAALAQSNVRWYPATAAWSRLSAEMEIVMTSSESECFQRLQIDVAAIVAETIRRATKVTIANSSSVERVVEFVSKCCVQERSASVTKESFRAAFAQWCDDNNLRPVRQSDVKTAMDRLHIREFRPSRVDKWRWSGIRLNSPEGC